MRKVLRYTYLLICSMAVVGCASVDFDMPKTTTYAPTDTDDTYLGKELDGVAEQHPGESGFFPLADGMDGPWLESIQSCRAASRSGLIREASMRSAASPVAPTSMLYDENADW